MPTGLLALGQLEHPRIWKGKGRNGQIEWALRR